jgi:potassium-transporting ATPase KdpC subunit
MRRQLLTALAMIIVMTVGLGIIYPLVVTGISQVAISNRANGSIISVKGKPVGSALLGQNFTDAKGNPLPQYFQPRPSDAGSTGYDDTASAASNLGPSNPLLIGFVPGVNTVNRSGDKSKTNVFATAADPFCVPTDPSGNPVTSPTSGQKYAKTHDGSYVCDPDTVPQRAIAYRQLNGLAVNAQVPVDAVTASASGLDPQISIANADLQAPRVARARGLTTAQVLALVQKNATSRPLGILGEPGVNVLQLNVALNALHQ